MADSDAPPTEDVPTQEGYDRWSSLYDEDDNPLILLEERHLPALLGDVAGLGVLDVGCGTGRHALRLAAAGARVTAVDFSAGMLARARQKPGAEAVRFLVHDLRGPLPCQGGSFDLVLCALVLDHVADVPTFFRELRRACRPGGRVVVSVMHPAMLLRGTQAGFIEPGSGRKVRPESHDNQISDYVMAAVRAGLRPRHMSEHVVDEALAARSPRAVRHRGWPLLLLMDLSRPEA
jgi:ubiquinone/menaquinone biosynthesis C-methylase UbiE